MLQTQCFICLRYTKYESTKKQKNKVIILRLPPYNCELMPIEQYWAKIKRKIRDASASEKANVETLKKIITEVVENTTKEDVMPFIDHVVHTVSYLCRIYLFIFLLSGGTKIS